MTTGGGETTGRMYGNQFQGYTYLSLNTQTTYYPGQRFTFFKPSAGLVIRTFVQKPLEIPTLDAAFLMNQITNRYHINLSRQVQKLQVAAHR